MQFENISTAGLTEVKMFTLFYIFSRKSIFPNSVSFYNNAGWNSVEIEMYYYFDILGFHNL